ncbi:MAG: hypothetical protein O7C65_05460 [Planctomycetota bacterium]|nr:hypothetical protein [Planctomycetota bacterium]
MIAAPIAPRFGHSRQEADIAVRRALRLVGPATSNQLHAYIRVVLGFDIPRSSLAPGNDAPFAYVEHAYFEDRLPRDCVVWANRGGGKTQLGAIATLLDMLFKPGIQVRILGGSFEQSSKMYSYLKQLLESEVFNDLIAGQLTGRAVELTNGSRVEVLSQSERAVRGLRVHRLRCDEVELFEPEVWEAVQMATRSGWCGSLYVRASIECLSTMHRPFGLMHRLVRDAQSSNRRVFRWSVLDTLRRCEPHRPCATCPLWTDCRGTAKQANGFIDIDDAIQQHARVSLPTWKSEMLCEQASRADTVYPEFDPKVHTSSFEIDTSHTRPPSGDQQSVTGVRRGGARQGVRQPQSHSNGGDWIGGIDFGYRSPTVLLWGWLNHEDILHIVDEFAASERTTGQVIAEANSRGWPRPQWIGADPAGHQRNEHTGETTIGLWKRAGWPVRTRSLSVEAGLVAVRQRLQRADGSIRLRIHRRCTRLIEALTMYHFPPGNPHCCVPVKDGHDHAADALRYMIISLDREARSIKVRHY